MKWVLEDHERDALNGVAFANFRAKVIAHARRKAQFTPEISDADYDTLARYIFAKVHAFLGRYESASYDSYVLMMLVYFTRGVENVEGRDMQASLRNDRFGINTRVRISYELVKVFIREGF